MSLQKPTKLILCFLFLLSKILTEKKASERLCLCFYCFCFYSVKTTTNNHSTYLLSFLGCCLLLLRKNNNQQPQHVSFIFSWLLFVLCCFYGVKTKAVKTKEEGFEKIITLIFSNLSSWSFFNQKEGILKGSHTKEKIREVCEAFIFSFA